MSDYGISKISPNDTRRNQLVDELLNAEGIRRDKNLDYTCGMFDENDELAATGSCYGNTLRCLAVSSRHQGEGLMNQLMTHMMETQFNRGNHHMFCIQNPQHPSSFRIWDFMKLQTFLVKLYLWKIRRQDLRIMWKI